MAKKDYEETVKQIFESIGGKENITSLTHCVTRLRFNLRDKSLVNEEELGKIQGIIGVKWSGDQLQLVIGEDVENVYKVACKYAGLEEEAVINENLDEDLVKPKFSIKRIANNVVSYVSSTMYNYVPILIAASLFKTIDVLLGPDLLNVISDTSDLYIALDFLYDVAFYFLPIFIGYTAAKTLKLEPLLGIFLGAMLIVPDFMAMVGVRETFSIFGITVPVADYSQTFLPVLIGVWLMSYVYKFFKKIIPEVVSNLFVPFLTFAVMAVVMFAICAPLGSYIGDLLNRFFLYLADSNAVLRIIGSTLLAAVMPFMVLFGMHQPIYMAAFATYFELGYEAFVNPVGQAYSYAVYGMALGAFIKYKKKEDKSMAMGYFVSGMLGGVSEPALYGVCMRNNYGIIILAGASAIGGLVAGILQPGLYSMLLANIFSTAAVWLPGGLANTIKGLSVQIISFVAGMIGVLLFDKLEDNKQ